MIIYWLKHWPISKNGTTSVLCYGYVKKMKIKIINNILYQRQWRLKLFHTVFQSKSCVLYLLYMVKNLIRKTFNHFYNELTSYFLVNNWNKKIEETNVKGLEIIFSMWLEARLVDQPKQSWKRNCVWKVKQHQRSVQQWTRTSYRIVVLLKSLQKGLLKGRSILQMRSQNCEWVINSHHQ